MTIRWKAVEQYFAVVPFVCFSIFLSLPFWKMIQFENIE